MAPTPLWWIANLQVLAKAHATVHKDKDKDKMDSAAAAVAITLQRRVCFDFVGEGGVLHKDAWVSVQTADGVTILQAVKGGL